MSTDDTSGNRWEPSPTSSGVDPTSEHPTANRTHVDPAAPSSPGGGWREELPGRRGWFAAGAAAVVFAVGGAGGFMVGHATAGATQDRDPFGQQGPRNGFGPGGNGQMPGQAPGVQPRSDDQRGQGSGSRGTHS